MRPYQPELAERFFRNFGREDHNLKEQKRVGQAVGRYGKALENWAQWRAIYAAQYLFMAAETLTTLARRRYFAKERTTEDELLKPFIGKLETAFIPANCTAEDAIAIWGVYERAGLPGIITDAARNKLNAEIRRKTIFRESPATHDALNKATNGMEHGFDGLGRTHRLVIPHLDQAATCVRKWILEETVRDETLISQLLTGECGTPLRTGKFSLIVGAEFRSDKPFATPAANCSPFRMEVVPSAPTPKVKSLMPSSVELRSVTPFLHVPESTFKAEAELHAERYERIYNETE